MCAPAVLIPIIATVAAGATKAYGEYSEGKAESSMLNYQGALSQQRAAVSSKYAQQQELGIKRSAASNITVTQSAAAEESKQAARNLAEITGQQKATIGALGIGGGTTAADLLTSSFNRATLDQMAIRYNANLKSWEIGEQAKQDVWALQEQTKQDIWGLGTESEMYRMGATKAKAAGKTKAIGTLLGTAAQVAYKR